MTINEDMKNDLAHPHKKKETKHKDNNPKNHTRECNLYWCHSFAPPLLKMGMFTVPSFLHHSYYYYHCLDRSIITYCYLLLFSPRATQLIDTAHIR
jgi:hypothetical protein